MDPVTFIAGFVSAHPYVTMGLMAGYWLASNVVSSLPSPDQASGKWYKFFFTLGNTLSASLARMFPFLRWANDPSRGNQTYFGSPKGD